MSFRSYSAILLVLLAGCSAGAAIWLQADKASSKLKARGLLWGSMLLALFGWGASFLVAKAGVFISALLFLVLWQVEQKTNLIKLVPLWYSELRTKITIIVAICHMIIWMTLPQ